VDDFANGLVLKTRRLGYDGKGQFVLRGPDDIAAALDAIGSQAAIAEELVEFSCEASIILARNRHGACRYYDMARNIHEGGVLRKSIAPAGLSPALEEKARAIAANIAGALDYVGALAVEFFVIDNGGSDDPLLLVNEIAPRVHNSGHWSLDACHCSQFENHIRAIAGWPLGPARRHSDAVMTNLLGEEAEQWRSLAAQAGCALHLYGKSEMRPGRKMGHVTQLSPISRRRG
jgi:5-(carboxyamino)imidazole ribonucleotide synthase